MINRSVSIAPMMAWTDRHFRYLVRLITKHTLLYTEMVHVDALLNQDPQRFLAYHSQEHPLALQVGGNRPESLAACARLAEAWQFDEINLNVGCPSPRVKKGAFGACLMAEPALVADCVRQMRLATQIPVTVKTRLGIDDRDSYPELVQFIETVAASGCQVFIMHARKAWLNGLSPKDNREIPPLKYEWVYQLQQQFPELTFVLNGGLKDLNCLQEPITRLAGVMIGREAYQNPYSLSVVDKLYYDDDRSCLTRMEIVKAYLDYMEVQMSQGVVFKNMAKHMLTMFQGQRGAKAWRRQLTHIMHGGNASLMAVDDALQFVTT